ncbi:MAG: glycoside hydrolase family 13 protein [Clostridia bacterium]|nr:glycoside hydrolase family 13 protein [Clostridia bacterium]
MRGINAYHDSTSLRFREPFGALRCGDEVLLRLTVSGPDAERVNAVLRIWNGAESFLPAQSEYEENGARVFVFRVKMADKPCVSWYHFRLHLNDDFFYVGAKDAMLRSGGSELTRELPHDYRITVYDRDFTTPEAFCGRIAYQIFPDRFARGEYPGLEAGIAHHRALGRRVTEKEWDEEVDYCPRGGERFYSPQDYYFGNFQGIIDKIPYLKSLGVEVLYLNPIFESAYNHRYSISDYMSVDPLLGTEEDFIRLTGALHDAGIKLMLDGVFSHTGDDSIYFDRRGNYGNGAYNDPGSPYREWYEFDRRYRHGFRCWWDFETLPEVEELTPSYMDFVAGVLEKWIRLGADGWRLDVADELPDEFIKFLRTRLKAISPDAVLIGEVWEDAVLKRDGHGRRREYANGAELDGVMDYPFRDAAVDFLLGRIDAAGLKAELSAQLEGYPRGFMRAQLGMLGSHDTERILSVLCGCPVKAALPRPAQAHWRPSAEDADKGKKRLLLASCLQFAMPFSPCIFYGDEAGLTGLADPFCRRPYPWGHEDNELMAHYRALTAARASCPVFADGKTGFASFGCDVFAVARVGGTEAVTLINRGSAKTVRLTPSDFSEGEATPILCGRFRDLMTGAVCEADGSLSIALPEYGFAVLALD